MSRLLVALLNILLLYTSLWIMVLIFNSPRASLRHGKYHGRTHICSVVQATTDDVPWTEETKEDRHPKYLNPALKHENMKTQQVCMFFLIFRSIFMFSCLSAGFRYFGCLSSVVSSVRLLLSPAQHYKCVFDHDIFHIASLLVRN